MWFYSSKESSQRLFLVNLLFLINYFWTIQNETHYRCFKVLFLVISRPINRKTIKFCFKILFYYIRENNLLSKFTLRWNLLQKYWITLLILLYIIIRIFCIWLLYFLRFIPKDFLEILQDIKSKNTLHNFNLCF
jgi:hypothetical protein